MKYWKCSKSLSAEIKGLWAHESLVINEMLALAESVGASKDGVFTSRSFGTMRMSGFAFDENPGKGWYKRKGEECWIPKAGTPARKKMELLKSDFMVQLAVLIGILKHTRELNFNQGWPGVEELGSTVYLITEDKYDKPVPGMKRVSDVSYENAKKKHRSEK